MRQMNELVGNFAGEMQQVLGLLQRLVDTSSGSQVQLDQMVNSTEELYQRMRVVDQDLEAIIALER